MTSLVSIGLLAACSASHLATRYDDLRIEKFRLDLNFRPNTSTLTSSSLERLARKLPMNAASWHAKLITTGNHSWSRTYAVEQVTGMAVRPYVANPADHFSPGAATLFVTGSFMHIDGCDQAPQRLPTALWPLTPETGPSLLPAGCATQRDLDIMLEDPNDMIRGRPLSPAQVQPFIDAARRYERRNQNKPPYGQDFPTTNGVSDQLENMPSATAASSGTSVAPQPAAAGTSGTAP